MVFEKTFAKGNLLRFAPFYFPDGGTPKAKFFVVLHYEEGQLLLASLPTSKDHVPSDVVLNSGCIELPERNFNAYVFLAGDMVTEDFAFPLNTFIYGTNIHAYNSETILQPVTDEKSKVEILGQIKSEVFSNLLDCLRNSSSVRRKYKAML